MTIEEVVQILNLSLPKPLTPLQEWVLRQSWEGKTYSSMAMEANYVEEYLRKTAAILWSLLSDFWGEAINKHNFRSTLEARLLTPVQQQLIADSNRSHASTPLEFPTGPLPLDSRFYILRPPVEELAYEEIAKPGSLTRLKAPRKMGKSSLVLRILAHGASLKYRCASIDFQQADASVFTSLDKFLRWLSANVSRELQLASRLDDYWDQEIGSKVSCTLYFQAYILEQIQCPVVLALNEVNRLFEYPEIAQDFLPLLRYWYEQAKKVRIWQNLRLIVSYSTEIYISLKLNQSPFNIGLPLKLTPFTKEQVQELAHRYELDWTDGSKLKRLMVLVGGHPYLVQLALYHLQQHKVTLKQVLEDAVTGLGIYQEYLQWIQAELESMPQLKAAFKYAIANEAPVKLDPIVAYKLDSMGLVTIEGDRVTPSCELYRRYFCEQLLEADELQDAAAGEAVDIAGSEQLETENRLLQQMLNLDELTQMANRRYFSAYLQTQWQRSASDRAPLSLILCEIDFFKAYNDIYGDAAGDSCLQQLALAIKSCVKHSTDLVARYSGDVFAVILPQTDDRAAVKIAEDIRKKVKSLKIITNNLDRQIGGFPDDVVTVSIGVASNIGSPKVDCDTLVKAAEQALYRSKRESRDRVTLSLASEQ